MYTVAMLVGSLRKDSFNKRLALAFERIGKDLFTFNNIPLQDMPFYNQDIEMNPPQPVINLRESIVKADGLLVISPEYNRSVTAVIKNAVDWASRPYGKNSIKGKPAATAGVSPGAIGTAVGQTHLKGILLMLNARVMGQPEMFIGGGDKLIDAQGYVSNPDTEKFFRSFLEKFSQWIGACKAGE